MVEEIKVRLETIEEKMGYYDQFYDLTFEEEMEYAALAKERRELIRALTDTVSR